jgi:hypothetical protein
MVLADIELAWFKEIRRYLKLAWSKEIRRSLKVLDHIRNLPS